MLYLIQQWISLYSKFHLGRPVMGHQPPPHNQHQPPDPLTRHNCEPPLTIGIFFWVFRGEKCSQLNTVALACTTPTNVLGSHMLAIAHQAPARVLRIGPQRGQPTLFDAKS